MSVDKLIKAGGPAFPLPDPFVMAPGNETEMRQVAVGMTLRDYFAAQALATSVAYATVDIDTWAPSDFAAHAYAIADAMLKARAA